MNPHHKTLKRFYFVRHGQTEDNVKKVYQSPSDRLTVVGKEQSMLVAERFVDIPVDLILSSEYERAFETAEAISSKTGIFLKKLPLFREIERPSDIIGKPKFEGEPKRIMDEMYANEKTPEWHHLDEENLFEALQRSREAVRYLCELPEENIVIVTHEMFMKMILTAMTVFDDAEAVQYYRHMRFFMQGDNTGITIAEYGTFTYDRKFRLRVWNDHTHLG